MDTQMRREALKVTFVFSTIIQQQTVWGAQSLQSELLWSALRQLGRTAAHKQLGWRSHRGQGSPHWCGFHTWRDLQAAWGISAFLFWFRPFPRATAHITFERNTLCLKLLMSSRLHYIDLHFNTDKQNVVTTSPKSETRSQCGGGLDWYSI